MVRSGSLTSSAGTVADSRPMKAHSVNAAVEDSRPMLVPCGLNGV
jgi:hypothetical protein